MRAARFVATVLATTGLSLPATAADKAAAIPDFSGIWGRNWLFLEPPPSGPGPILSKLKKPDGTEDLRVAQVGDYTNPLLKPQAAGVVKRLGEVSLTGTAYPDPHNQCRPEPTPFTLSVQFGLQILQRKDEVILLYLADHKARHVRMNLPHPTKLAPTWQGDSIGHYEGDTLVIDTVGQKVGPLAMVDIYGTPYSPALHVIERYRLVDGTAAREAQLKHQQRYFPPGVSSPLTNEYGRGDIDDDAAKKGLQVEVRVEDPAMFTAPWSGLVTYRHVLGDWPEAVCAENTHEYYANKDTDVPHADKPDF